MSPGLILINICNNESIGEFKPELCDVFSLGLSMLRFIN